MKTNVKKIFVFDVHTAKLRSNKVLLEYSSKQDEKMIMAYWSYSREEWNVFLRWKILRKGIFHYLLHWAKALGHKPVPEIKITPGKVWIDNTHEPGYEQGNIHNEIRIPIPKGKLRDAFQVQDQLMKTQLSVV
jgi:hypothetical protein